MITPTYVPPIATPDPQCPHCHGELHGWSEPSNSDFSLTAYFLDVVGLLIAIQVVFAIGGVVDGSGGRYWHGGPEEECGKWFSKRWHYVVPSYQASCRLTEWLRNNEDKSENLEKRLVQ